MKKFILTSPRFIGSIIFAFNEEGILITYINETDLAAEGLNWMLSFLPNHVDHLAPLGKKITGKIEEVPMDISFEAFWEAYNQKINKKRCIDLYKKLSDTDKPLCVMAIKAYQKYCNGKGRAIADPEKYLAHRYFETDWRGLR